MNSCEFTCRPCDGDCPSEPFTENDAARLLAAFHLQDVESEVPLINRLIIFVRARTLDSLKDSAYNEESKER